MRRFVVNISGGAFCLLLLLAGERSHAQVTVQGTIFNMYKTRPLTAVSVMSTSGKGTMTDANGNYMIVVNENDSLYFSYLGKPTAKYPVRDLNTANHFDLALHVDPTELKEVRISPRDYHMDSLQNRKDYAKIFDYKKPGLHINQPGQGLGVGLDLDALIEIFEFNKKRRTLAFQDRLIEEEHEKFVDHKFNGAIVKRITHMADTLLPNFLIRYRPSYEFVKKATDYEILDYIKLAYAQFADEEGIEYTPSDRTAKPPVSGKP